MRMHIAIFFACAVPCIAGGHGFVGDRFFPPTITTDDPFATDELSLPTVSISKNAAGGGSAATEQVVSGFEFDKEVFPKFAVGVTDDYIWQKPDGQSGAGGWDNLSLSLKYQLWQNDAHEAIVSIGAEADIGGTGDDNVGADSFTTFTPIFYFGKGFGDLPESLNPLRPIAVTGTIGQTFPTSAAASNALQWGLAVEYSIPYLQGQVADVGLPAPFKNMIPVVEFTMQTVENRTSRGQTTGTINPGVMWEFPDFQIGAEVLIPVNGHTGPHVGVVVNLQIYIDDLFPKTFGHPIWGTRS